MISKTPGTVTAGELFQIRDAKHRYELVDGVLKVMAPAGSERGRVALLLGC